MQPSLTFAEPGCAFVNRYEAGLINHVRQKYGSVAEACHCCTICGQLYHKQGLPVHEKFYQKNPTREELDGGMLQESFRTVASINSE